MGHSYRRTSKDGKPRYAAMYNDARGQRRSAGTYSTRKGADKAWRNAEAKVSEGRLGDPRRGRVSFQTYVEDTWLPNHELEITTRERYTYSIAKPLMPTFGPLRMAEILPEHVRAGHHGCSFAWLPARCPTSTGVPSHSRTCARPSSPTTSERSTAAAGALGRTCGC